MNMLFGTYFFQHKISDCFSRAACLLDYHNEIYLSLGSVGPFFSSAAVVAAEFASSVPTSLISPRAATPLLSDKTMFPTFLRTVPSLSALSQVNRS